jgi:hypothetical protein
MLKLLLNTCKRDRDLDTLVSYAEQLEHSLSLSWLRGLSIGAGVLLFLNTPIGR